MMKEPVLRSQIPQEMTWDLTLLYASPEEWEKDFKRLNGCLKQVKKFKGHLGDSPETLKKALEASDRLSRLSGKLFTYAHLRSDEDTANSENRARVDRMIAKGAEIGGATAWFEPELLAMDKAKFRKLCRSSVLKYYHRSLKQLEQARKHTLSEPEERILELSSEVMSGSYKAFEMLNDADLQFPVIRNEKGEEVRLTHGSYRLFMESPDRNVRKSAFDGIYTVYSQHKNTFASLLDTEVKSHVLEARLRKHPSALESSLFDDAIPRSVYDSLIEAVRKGIAPLHNYFACRADRLGLDKLHMYDIMNPLNSGFSREIPWDEAVRDVKEALKPLGDEYGSILNRAFQERWIDIPECKGKRSGAYSGGCYDSVPYLLLNHTGNLDSVFTLAHELGHSMHSWFSNHSNGYHYADYKIFVAEIASTTNEVLLYHHLSERASGKEEKEYLLNNMLDTIRGTLYRQTMFAEFELKIHEMAEKDEPLTADSLSGLYYGLNQFYHGPRVVSDDFIRYEWARIPHFHYDFYVFQYATGISAALALAGKILKGETEAYLGFLRAGDSKDAIDIMKDAGVDFTSPAPVKEAIASFAGLVKQLKTGSR